jgi:anti-sigma factor RsiW
MNPMSHLTDQELLLAIDGELPAHRVEPVARHLAGCPSCSARRSEIERSIVDFVRFHQEHLDPLVPPPAGQRAVLKARLAEAASTPLPRATYWKQAAAVPESRCSTRAVNDDSVSVTCVVSPLLSTTSFRARITRVSNFRDYPAK